MKSLRKMIKKCRHCGQRLERKQNVERLKNFCGVLSVLWTPPGADVDVAPVWTDLPRRFSFSTLPWGSTITYEHTTMSLIGSSRGSRNSCVSTSLAVRMTQGQCRRSTVSWFALFRQTAGCERYMQFLLMYTNNYVELFCT